MKKILLFIFSTFLLFLICHGFDGEESRRSSLVYLPELANMSATLPLHNDSIALGSIQFAIDLHILDLMEIVKANAGQNNEGSKNCLNFFVCYLAALNDGENKTTTAFETKMRNVPGNKVAIFCGQKVTKSNENFHGIGIDICLEQTDGIRGKIGFSFANKEWPFKLALNDEKWTNLSLQFGMGKVQLIHNGEEIKELGEAEMDFWNFSTWTEVVEMFNAGKLPSPSMVIFDTAYSTPSGQISAFPVANSTNFYYRQFLISHPANLECKLEKQFGEREFGQGWTILNECQTGGGLTKKPNCEEKCGQCQGKENNDKLITSFISRGQPVIDPMEWPWLVSLSNYDISLPINGTIVRMGIPTGCTGAILDPEHILTAAHCVKLTIINSTLFGRTILAGQPDLADPNVQIRFASKIYLPDDFMILDALKNMVFKNDIAVIKLSHPLEFNERISCICLTKIPKVDMVGKEAIIIGWGYTEEMNIMGKNATYLETKLNNSTAMIISSKECLSIIEQTSVNVTKLNKKMLKLYEAETLKQLDELICVIGEHNSSVQQGDSGGPLIRYNEDEGRFETLGVASTGFLRFSEQTRQAPALFISVEKNRQWIHEAKSGKIKPFWEKEE